MEEIKEKQVELLSKAIHSEAREYFMTGSIRGRSECEIVAEETIIEFVDYLDSLKYIRDFNLLAKAVCFYMMHSSDHIEIKKRVQAVYESVMENDEVYKECHDKLHILKNALDGLFEINRNRE